MPRLLLASAVLLLARTCGSEAHTQQAEGADDVCADYCAKEAECIPTCLCRGEGACACASPERTADCPAECVEWVTGVHRTSTAACNEAHEAYAACVAGLTCGGVETHFVHAEPDAVPELSPCHEEWRAAREACVDFESLTEYNFE